ncbi:MAG TPA: hypothetical protein VGY55_18655 [Pirellulales bacterium]|jgi:hypothetical protein|nr:hypothetical protein [Pirellulales bacterium]
MNQAISSYDDQRELKYEVEFRHMAPQPNQRFRRADFVRRNRPTGYNGIHRRRNRRFTW